HRIRPTLLIPVSPIDTQVVNMQNDTLVVNTERILAAKPSTFAGAAISMDSGERPATDTRTAGVVARPPLLFLAALLAGFVLDRFAPLLSAVPGVDPVHWIIGGSLILIGLALTAAGIRNFSQAGTPVPTNRPTRHLVTTGIHRWTRNPIYLGMFLIYGGIGLAALSPWILVFTPPLAIANRHRGVPREGADLRRALGGA